LFELKFSIKGTAVGEYITDKKAFARQFDQHLMVSISVTIESKSPMEMKLFERAVQPASEEEIHQKICML